MQEAIGKLPNNRDLSYAVYGPAEGYPVLYFHGTPSSRNEILLLESFGLDVEALLQEFNLRLIAPDRGAFTTFDPSRTFLSFAAEAEQLLRQLGIRQCALLCWSGGGPYALAMAHRYPALVTGVYVLCGLTRPLDKAVLAQMGLNKYYFLLARHAPFLLRLLLGVLRQQKIKSLPPQKLTGFPYVDYRLLRPSVTTLARLTMKEATRKSTRPMVHEASRYFHPFGFSLAEIAQPIHYWWGTLDMAVVELHAREIEQTAQQPVMHYREGEGHLSLYVNCFREALQEIRRSLGAHTSFGRQDRSK